MFWVVFWKVSLIVAVALFSVMAIAVTVGGAFDVRQLLRRLSDADDTTRAQPNDDAEPNRMP